MKVSFSRLMEQATRLTRRGELRHAVAVIREALGGQGAPGPTAPSAPPPERPAHAAAPDEVVDVAFRELAPEGLRTEAPVSARPSSARPVADLPAAAPPAEAAPFTAPARVQPDSPQTPRAGAPAPAASATPARFLSGEFSSAAGARAYKLYVPPGPHPQPLPLVVMLHGCTQNPDDFAAGTGMNAAALARGFFVLYPAQSQAANITRCWNWFKPKHQRRGSGEPAILAGMVQQMLHEHPIDPRRVYVAGLSAGGAMAAILGDAYPDLFAAVGVHSGLPTGAASDMATAFAAMQSGRPSGAPGNPSPPPTIVFHGDHDGTVHPGNAERVLATQATASEPQAERARSRNGREYTRRIFRDASGRPQAEQWMVHGAGHAWSGGQAGGSYTDAQGPDATDEMLRFFFLHALPADPPQG